jgi:hydrogenase maturation protein HypF
MSDAANTQRRRLRIVLDGAVQGFGLCPTVYRAAQRLRLTGWVRRSGADVEIEVEGGPDRLDRFLGELELQLSSSIGPVAQTTMQVMPVNSKWFEILPDFNRSSQSAS